MTAIDDNDRVATALTPEEAGALARHLVRLSSGSGIRLATRRMGDRTQLGPDHRDVELGLALLADAIGTSDMDLLNGVLKQLADATSKNGQVQVDELNFMLSVIKGISPKDPIETMLAAQMAATHTSAMAFVPRLAQANSLPQLDSAERIFNKLMRTFATQVEALKRYRSSGEQKVTVNHVSISKGGQAIVGNVTQEPCATAPEKTAASPKALAQPVTAPMPIIDDYQAGVLLPLRTKAKK